MDYELRRVTLVRYGEIMLKGLNRHSFEEKLANNIMRAVGSLGSAKARIGQGRIYVLSSDRDFNFDEAARRAAEVFGVVSAGVAWECDERDEGALKAVAAAAVKDRLADGAAKRNGAPLRFKVESKRGDKGYPLTSPEISRLVGEYLVETTPELVVNVTNPEAVVKVEVRDRVYSYASMYNGFGGLPIGTNGKALLLLSGGIDSPVAGFMMAKRGVSIAAVHFYSYPYTGERAREKVVTLSKILAGYFGKIELYIVPFTKTQLLLRDVCREEYLTVVTRRAMMKIAELVAERACAQALVTGESMGQVASQTIMALAATDRATDLPVFRPLIGMDKREVIALAERIGTYETSILPYEDCCTIFTPKHPKTKPKTDDVIREESRASGLDSLIEEAASEAELIVVKNDR